MKCQEEILILVIMNFTKIQFDGFGTSRRQITPTSLPKFMNNSTR